MIRIDDNTFALRPLRLDAGFQFGLAVFETILVLRLPLFWEEHCRRLNSGLEDLAVREPIDPDWLLRQAGQLEIANCVLKILVSPENIVFQTRDIPDESTYAHLQLTICPDPRPRDMRLLRNKNCNYLANLLAWQDARTSGFADALFITDKYLVTECSRSNIFWIKQSKLYTPSQECGLLPGIVRQWLINRFAASCGKYEKNDIYQAETVLATNSVMGVREIKSIDAKHFPGSTLLPEIIKTWQNEVIQPAR